MPRNAEKSKVRVDRDAPTAAQVSALESMGIVPPSKARAAATLLRWVSNGGSESGKRIGIIIEAQKQYLGKRVRKHVSEGTVQYLFWQHLGIKAKMREGQDHRYNHPLTAMVKWDHGATYMAHLNSELVLLAEGESPIEAGTQSREE